MMRMDPRAGAVAGWRVRTAASDIDGLPDQGKLKVEGGAAASVAFHRDLACVLLDDPVGNGKAETRAPRLALARRGLSGEKGIVDLVDMLRRNAPARIAHAHVHATAIDRRDAQRSPARHGVLGVHEQVEKYLLQLAGIAVNHGQVTVQISFHFDTRSLELMLEQGKRFLNDLVDVNIAELGGTRARKIQQVVNDLRSPERLPRDLVRKVSQLRVAVDMLGEQLGVTGDDCQWRIHFMGNARGQQADRRHLFRLRQLRFQLHTLGDVVYDDQAADHAEFAGYQRSNGHVGNARIAGRGVQPEFVKVMDPRVAAYADELIHKRGREHLAEPLSQHLGARQRVHHFHLRVPG